MRRAFKPARRAADPLLVPVRITRRHLGAAALGVAAALPFLALIPAAPVVQAAETPHASAGFAANETWAHSLNDANSPVALSSPNVANLDGQPSVVFGDRAGFVYAYHLNGGGTPGGHWPYGAGAPVDSSPSVAAINGNGLDTVYVGTGNVSTPSTGGY